MQNKNKNKICHYLTRLNQEGGVLMGGILDLPFHKD
jgi:hypothetical protein